MEPIRVVARCDQQRGCGGGTDAVTRKQRRSGLCERDPTELALTAQPPSHRPTGACNTTHIIAYDPPSRLCATWEGLCRPVGP